jgi:hypothetical protein
MVPNFLKLPVPFSESAMTAKSAPAPDVRAGPPLGLLLLSRLRCRAVESRPRGIDTFAPQQLGLDMEDLGDALNSTEDVRLRLIYWLHPSTLLMSW